MSTLCVGIEPEPTGRGTDGRTAYRIWTEGWGSIVNKEDEGEPESRPQDEYDHATSRSEPPSPQVPTTPRRAHRHYDPSSPSIRRRPPSSAGSRRRRRPQRQTIAELLANQAESSTPRRPYTPDSDLTSGSSLTGLTGMTDGPYSPSALDTITASDLSEESGDETNTRLAAMAHRVQGLIAEGRAALTTPVSTPRARPVSGTISPSPIASPSPIDIPRPKSRERRVSGWDTGTDTDATDATGSDERVRPASSASMASRQSQSYAGGIGIGHPPRNGGGTTSRPVSVSSLPRSASSSSSSRYQPVIPPLPWRRESIGATGRWVQKQHSPSGSLSGRPPPPQSNGGDVEARSPPAQHEIGRASPRAHDSGSRIPRPGHSRTSSATGADSPSPALRPEGREGRGVRIASSASNASSTGERGGWNSPVSTHGIVAARTSLFSSVAERNANGSINRSKIPIRRSIGSISSMSAVQTPSPKA